MWDTFSLACFLKVCKQYFQVTVKYKSETHFVADSDCLLDPFLFVFAEQTFKMMLNADCRIIFQYFLLHSCQGFDEKNPVWIRVKWQFQ